MLIKLKYLSWVSLLAIALGGIYAYTSVDTLIQERTSVNTRVRDDFITDTDINEIANDVDFESFNNQPSKLTPPVSGAPKVPVAAKRTPGTKLNEKILNDLNINEPLLEEQVFYATATPNDTIYPQWYTTVIDAPTAWDTSTGNNSILVAIIDTGYALEHEDLSDAWFINTGEQGITQNGDICWTGTPSDKQTNACDDDNNGMVDDWRGWDFANNDNNPQAGDNFASGANHGTKSAGLVGARGNNGVGVASVNWGAKLLPLQGLSDEGFGYSTDITAAIYYAVEMGADVINMSLGGPTPDTFTLAAVRYAAENNVIIVASAGNCGTNQTSPNCIGYVSPGGMSYPARFLETISVGATTSTDERAGFSSYGPELDVVAPGSGSIRTTSWSISNDTTLYSTSSFGTSFSAPIVSGAVALIKGEFPEITKDEVISILYGSSDRVPSMNGASRTDEYGFGRLNVNNLLTELTNYRQQLDKSTGQIAQQNSTTTPQISTNTGHTAQKAIGDSTTVHTYCVTSPGTLCSLKLDKRNSSQVVNFGPILANNHGVAVFSWQKSNASAGTWDATVTANSKTSQKEKLIIQ